MMIAARSGVLIAEDNPVNQIVFGQILDRQRHAPIASLAMARTAVEMYLVAASRQT